MWEWQPSGKHCAGAPLPKRELMETSQLATQFCSKWAGRSLVFVGDSIQAQFFTSFVHQVGFVKSVANTSSACCAMMYGGGSHECDLTVTLCGGAVRARFLRNHFLYLDRARSTSTAARRWLVTTQAERPCVDARSDR
jgi:hypothetical protein